VVTAKALKQALQGNVVVNDNEEAGELPVLNTFETPHDIRIINDKRFLRRPDWVILWGNSYVDIPEGARVINPKQAVINTANKGEMARILTDAEGVRFPDVSFNPNEFNSVADENGNVFIRSGENVVRYCNSGRIRQGDQYATKPINKVREYRVHVFNDKTLGVYQKEPNNPEEKIYKSHNCRFRRVNIEVEIDLIRGVRPMARAAVRALGLVYGGVDVLVTQDSSIYVNEVNSSPSLNSPNTIRWANEFINFIQNNNG
jgi:hypothetical protein